MWIILTAYSVKSPSWLSTKPAWSTSYSQACLLKEIELSDLGVVKKRRCESCWSGRFLYEQGGRGRAGARTISCTAGGGYSVQWASRPVFNRFHCKKNGPGWRDCTQYSSTDDRKKRKASEKGKQWEARQKSSPVVREMGALAITDENDPEEIEICSAITDDYVVKDT